MVRVAVVEDNPDNRLLLRALLADDYELDEYENGSEALDGMRRRLPQVALLDISLPGMDGVEVLRKMRGDPALNGVYAVAVTAHAMTGDRQRYIDAGFDDYLPKPIVDERTLHDAIRRGVRGA